MQPGDFVLIHSLNKTPEHNGQLGQITEFVAARERFSVRLLGGQRVIHIKEANLSAAPEQQLRDKRADLLLGLSKPQLVALIGEGEHGNVAAMSVEQLSNLALDLGREYVEPSSSSASSSSSSPNASSRPVNPRAEEQARMFEQMSVSDMKKRLTALKSATPNQLRQGAKELRGFKDAEVRAAVQPEIDLLAKMLISPEAKRAVLHEIRTGELSSYTTDEELERRARDQLELFKRDPAVYKRQLGPSAESLSNDDILSQLEMSTSLSGAELRRMQTQAARAGGAGGGMGAMSTNDPDKLSDEQLTASVRMQLDMFDRDPAGFKSRLPAQQRAMMAGMPDDALRQQLVAATKMTPKELRDQMRMAKSLGGGPGGAMPTAPENTAAVMQQIASKSGEELLTMVRMVRDRMRVDPQSFARSFPAQAQTVFAQPGAVEFMQGMVETVAEWTPARLKQIVGFVVGAQAAYSWVDVKSGGRGQMVAGAAAVLVVSLLVTGVMYLLWTLIGLVGRLVFGWGSGSTAAAANAPAGKGVPVVPIEQAPVVIDDDVVVAEEGWDEV